MQRQKVKGTGHKQPADVQTEPNFYNMSPSKSVPSGDASENPSSPPVASTSTATALISVAAPEGKVSSRPGNAFADLSPGMGGVHNAAQLLKGLASGVPFSLGKAASQGSSFVQPGSVASAPPSTAPATSAKALPAQSDPFALQQSSSMSLLGRVTNVGETPANLLPGTTSAFFWPPRTTSTLIHPSPGAEPVPVAKDPPPIEGSNTSVPPRNEEQTESVAKNSSSNVLSSEPVSKAEEKESGTQPRLIPEPSSTKAMDSETLGATSTTGREASIPLESPLRKEGNDKDGEFETLSFDKSKIPKFLGEQKVSKGIETEEV